MGLDFINRVAKASVILALIQLPFVTVYIGWHIAVGVLLGAFWGAANLMLIKYIVTGIITPNPKSKKRALILGAIKFPLLYGLGYLLLVSEIFTPVSLLAGFTIIFLVAFLKALGRYLLDNKIISSEMPKNFNKE